MLRRVCAAVALIVLVLGLGACADGEVKQANAYVGAVNQAQERFTGRSQALLSELAAGTPGGETRAVLERVNGVVGGFVEELEAIEPPPRVRALHERLVGAAARFGGQLRIAGGEIVSGNAGRILDGQERLAEAGPRMASSVNATIAAINDALTG